MDVMITMLKMMWVDTVGILDAYMSHPGRYRLPAYAATPESPREVPQLAPDMHILKLNLFR